MAEFAGKVNGTLYLMYFDGSALGRSTSSSMDITIATIATTDKGSGGWAEGIEGGGTRAASFSFEGFYDQSQTVNMEELFAKINGRTDVTFLFQPSVAGNLAYGGAATITSISLSAANEEAMTLSGTMESNGAVTETTTA